MTKRAADPLASYRGRSNAATGRAAEAAWVKEQRRCGAGLAWSSKAGASPHENSDMLDSWDTIALTEHYTVLSQVKAWAKEPWPPPQLWLTRFMGSPHPPSVRFLLVWLTPAGQWRVWRLLPDGTRLEVAWPPETGRGES